MLWIKRIYRLIRYHDRLQKELIEALESYRQLVLATRRGVLSERPMTAVADELLELCKQTDDLIEVVQEIW